MARNKKKVTRMTKGEKLLWCLIVLAFGFSLGIKTFCGAVVSELKMDIEKSKSDIDTWEKKNESLTMKVNELTSFENVKGVVKEMGLAYNNDNIIVVNE